MGQLLSNGGNTAKAFRRLDEVLSETKVAESFVHRVCRVLNVPDEQLAVAWEAHLDQVMAWRVESRKRAAQEMMDRRGPHLWGVLPKGYHPSLITVIGPESFLLVQLPEGIAELPEFEQLSRVGIIARHHYAEQRKCRLVEYEFRASLHRVYRISVDGECLGQTEAELSDSRSIVRIGGKRNESSGLHSLFGSR